MLKIVRMLVPVMVLTLCVILLIYHHTETMIRGSRSSNNKIKHMIEPRNEVHNGTSQTYHQECSLFPVNQTTLNTYGKIKHKAVDYDENTIIGKRILILTPLSDAADLLQDYFGLLCSLSYPHHLISIGLGEDSSRDKSYEIALRLSKRLKHSFASINVYKLTDTIKPGSFNTRHDIQYQTNRRSHLAKSRNELLMSTIEPEYDWVLWLDSDVIYYPPNLIQLLLSAQKDVVVPVCLMKQKYNHDFIIYDKNSWRETVSSLQYLSQKSKDFLMLEGYEPTKRKYINSLRQEGNLVEIDGVGGCTLLIRGTCHREGLIFPSFVFDHHIETEGLGKMAKQMGYSVYALPFVSVIHAN